jgi:hypothetical protein
MNLNIDIRLKFPEAAESGDDKVAELLEVLKTNLENLLNRPVEVSATNNMWFAGVSYEDELLGEPTLEEVQACFPNGEVTDWEDGTCHIPLTREQQEKLLINGFLEFEINGLAFSLEMP